MQRALGYLKRVQRSDGGWAADAPKAVSDLSTTSIAGLALLRSGDAMASGPLRKAESFVVDTIALADDAILLRPNTGDPLVQADLGVGIDAVLAAWFLAELMAVNKDEPGPPRGEQSLKRLLGIIGESHEEMGFRGQGSQLLTLALAGRAFESAEACGIEVDDKARRCLFMEALSVQKRSAGLGASFYELAAVVGALHAGAS